MSDGGSVRRWSSEYATRVEALLAAESQARNLDDIQLAKKFFEARKVVERQSLLGLLDASCLTRQFLDIQEFAPRKFGACNFSTASRAISSPKVVPLMKNGSLPTPKRRSRRLRDVTLRRGARRAKE
jgi:hypothetical protein